MVGLDWMGRVGVDWDWVGKHFFRFDLVEVGLVWMSLFLLLKNKYIF